MERDAACQLGDSRAAATIDYAEAINAHKSWDETVQWLVRKAQDKDPRLQAMYSTWAAVDRVDRRITRDEHAMWSELWTLHIGRDSPSPKRHLGIQHWIS